MNNPVAWTLVFHITGFVFWIGGLLFAIQSLALYSETADPAQRLAHTRSAARSMRALAHPGAALVVVTGVLMLSLVPEFLQQGWLHAKLGLVVLLIIVDLLVNAQVRRMPDLQITRARTRLFHSAVALLFFFILILVLIKPF